MNNKYYWHFRITERKFRLIVNNFATGNSPAEAAEKVRLTRKSVNTIFLKIRSCICKYGQSHAYVQLERFKTPDCNFIAGSELSLYNSKQRDIPVVFCAFLGNGTIQTDIIYASDSSVFKKLEIAIQNTKDRNIMDFGFSDTRLNKVSTLYYGFPTFYLDYGKSVNQFRDFARPRLNKLRGIKSDKLILHLKECEWRFNNQNNDLYLLLLEMLRNNPI